MKIEVQIILLCIYVGNKVYLISNCMKKEEISGSQALENSCYAPLGQ
jgi:hypothetical protein